MYLSGYVIVSLSKIPIQLKEAMTSILGQLVAGDRFNILTFSGDVIYWKRVMVEIEDEDGREEALSYVNNIKASGCE